MNKSQAALLLVAAFASSVALAQQAGQKSGTERPRGVVTGGSGDGGIALHSDAAKTGSSAVSGGVSLNARDALRTQERDANLKMVFSLNTGNYVSDVHIKVVDSRGNAVIDDTSNGPWVLAKLPAGSYKATATYNDKAVTQRISVGKSGMRTAHFRWHPSVEGVGSADAAAGGSILGTGPQEMRR